MKIKIFTGITAFAMAALMLSSCGSSVKSVADLNGKKIGVQAETTAAMRASNIEGAELQKFNKYSDAVKALEQGTVAAVIIDSETAEKYTGEGSKVKLLDEDFVNEEHVVVIKPGSSELKKEIDSAIKILTDNGTLENIHTYYESENAGENKFIPDEGIMRQKGELKMATSTDIPPFVYNEMDTIAGSDADFMRAASDRLCYEIVMEDMDRDTIISAVAAGEYDVGVAAFTADDAKDQDVMLSEPYATTHLVVMVKK